MKMVPSVDDRYDEKGCLGQFRIEKAEKMDKVSKEMKIELYFSKNAIFTDDDFNRIEMDLENGNVFCFLSIPRDLTEFWNKVENKNEMANI